MWSCPCCLRFKFTPEELEQRYKSREIDKMIEKDKQLLKRQVKLLLLGAGESGKSTFLKQMRIIHGVKFELELVKEYQQVIYQNVVKGMRVLVDARDKLGIPWGDTSNDEMGRRLIEFNNTVMLDSKLFVQYEPLIAKLWMDSGIRRAFDRRREFQLVSIIIKVRLDLLMSNTEILFCFLLLSPPQFVYLFCFSFVEVSKVLRLQKNYQLYYKNLHCRVHC